MTMTILQSRRSSGAIGPHSAPSELRHLPLQATPPSAWARVGVSERVRQYSRLADAWGQAVRHTVARTRAVAAGSRRSELRQHPGEGRAVGAECREVVAVHLLDGRGRAVGEVDPGCGRGQRSSSGVRGVRRALDETLGLEVAQHLGGHHRVCSGVLGQLPLGDRTVVSLLLPGQ